MSNDTLNPPGSNAKNADAAHLPAARPSENHRDWHSYIYTLRWVRGQLDNSSWLAALRAASLDIGEQHVFVVLSRLIEAAGDEPKPKKIRSQIDRARSYVRSGQGDWNDGADQPGAFQIERPVHYDPCPAPSKRVQVEFKPEVLKTIAAKVELGNIEEFVRSRSKIHPDLVSSERFLAELYLPGEKVLIFLQQESQGQAVWARDRYRTHQGVPLGGPDGVWFLTNPVDGRYYPNPRQDGEMSRRSQESVTSFRFAVLESDKADAQDWLRFLVQLPFRIAAIYSSGGRSLHALVRIDAASKGEWDSRIHPVKPLLKILGADPGALTAVRLSRLPQAFRGDNRQALLYINPQPDGTPILALPPRTPWREGLDWAIAVANRELRPEGDDLARCIAALETHHTDREVAAVLPGLQCLQTEGKP